ncbi:MAG TPA: pyrroloquinoline quinone biosynthesis protein PqqB [Gemmatimonadales bacterium]|nr:pyrroloquinoline quinone biosynthesis protein PqqB [Gemmatimonadales bacterium]
MQTGGSRKRAPRRFQVQIILLGTAAGGGFPQWNCWCPPCRTARSNPARARPRTQSSAAVSVDGSRWFLLNASPDIREQLTRLPSPVPTGARHVPVAGVVATDAELDHTLGIVLLREGRWLRLYTTCAVAEVLERDSRLLPVTRAFADVDLVELHLGRQVALRYAHGTETGVTVEAFAVPAGPPRFASTEAEGHTVGLLLRDSATGGVCAFVPGCGGLDKRLMSRLHAADLVLFDGTFWTDDELIALGIGDRTARQMDHLPMSGPEGSLELLATLPGRHRVYTHINNTNPVLVEGSPERALVERAGLTVGMDGMHFEI